MIAELALQPALEPAMVPGIQKTDVEGVCHGAREWIQIRTIIILWAAPGEGNPGLLITGIYVGLKKLLEPAQ